MGRGLLLLAILFAGCAPPEGGGLNATQKASIPFLINGEDTGYKLLTVLSNYSRMVQPMFGPDGDAEVLESDDTLTVRFHPTQKYLDVGGHGAANQYFLYVGLLPPPLSEDGEGGILEGGMAERPSVKEGAVRFNGEFRFESGTPEVRKSFFLTPTFMYFKNEPFEYKQIAFNNHGGLQDHPAEDLYFDHVEFGWDSGWHNVYWGDWWSDEACAPDPTDASVPSEWIPFDMDLSAASERALTWANAEWSRREGDDDYFNTDAVELWAAYLGPEYRVGEGELVFSVRNLNLDLALP
jgi:hypothetical protein